MFKPHKAICILRNQTSLQETKLKNNIQNLVTLWKEMKHSRGTKQSKRKIADNI